MLNISAARRKNRTAAELNMAPLIDMVFILLIFFLVNTSFVKETGIDVSRPTAATAAVKPNATILIAVDQANRIFMDHREIDLRAVRANVERALAENPEGAVVVVADKQEQQPASPSRSWTAAGWRGPATYPWRPACRNRGGDPITEKSIIRNRSWFQLSQTKLISRPSQGASGTRGSGRV